MNRLITGLFVTTALASATAAFADDTSNYGITPGANDTFTPSDSISDSAMSDSRLDQQAGQAGTVDASGADNVTINNNAPSDAASDPMLRPGLGDDQPGTAAPSNNRYDNAAAPMSSNARADESHEGYLDRTVVHLQPQVGAINFEDAAGNTATRAALGLTMDMNFASAINSEAGNLFFGPATGVIFSHVGAPNSNFFGTDSSVGGNSDANALIIPANLKVGFAFGPMFRLSARGGANVLYRSVESSMNLGSEAGWKLFPNVGGDIEFGFGPNVSLMLRPDVTFTPNDNILTGTLGLQIGLG